jgi:hypothetical protein
VRRDGARKFPPRTRIFEAGTATFIARSSKIFDFQQLLQLSAEASSAQPIPFAEFS